MKAISDRQKFMDSMPVPSYYSDVEDDEKDIENLPTPEEYM